MSKVYLASNFAHRDFLRETVKPYLESRGHEVTSRWIWDDTHLEHGPLSEQRSAMHDLQDIDAAGALILYSDQHGPRQGKRKFIELGYAIRAGKICILLGGDQGSSVFYSLPTIRHADNIEDACRYLIESAEVQCA